MITRICLHRRFHGLLEVAWIYLSDSIGFIFLFLQKHDPHVKDTLLKVVNRSCCPVACNFGFGVHLAKSAGAAEEYVSMSLRESGSGLLCIRQALVAHTISSLLDSPILYGSSTTEDDRGGPILPSRTPPPAAADVHSGHLKPATDVHSGHLKPSNVFLLFFFSASTFERPGTFYAYTFMQRKCSMWVLILLLPSELPLLYTNINHASHLLE